MPEINIYLELLWLYDAPKQWEASVSFDYRKELNNYFRAKDRIESELREKIKFKTNTYIQGAFYHSVMPREVKHTMNSQASYPQIDSVIFVQW
jgi:hypothetical protein